MAYLSKHIYFKYNFTWLRQKLFVTVLNVSFYISDFYMTEAEYWGKTRPHRSKYEVPRDVQEEVWDKSTGLRQTGKSEAENDKSRHQGGKNLRFSQESWKNTHLVILFKPILWGRNVLAAWQVWESIWWRVLDVRSQEAMYSRSLWGVEEDFLPGMWARKFPPGSLQDQPEIETWSKSISQVVAGPVTTTADLYWVLKPWAEGFTDFLSHKLFIAMLPDEHSYLNSSA